MIVAAKGILHMIYCWSESEDFIFMCWVICQTRFRTAANRGCSQILAGHFTVSKRGRNAGSSSLSASLFHFTSPSLLLHFSRPWWTMFWTTICMESETCHTFPQKTFVSHSYINKKKESAASVVDVETFRASQEVNICNNWHPEDSSRVWSLYRGYFGSWRQFWLMPLLQECRANPYFFFFCRLPIY